MFTVLYYVCKLGFEQFNKIYSKDICFANHFSFVDIFVSFEC